MSFIQGLRMMLGYDAITDKSRRKSPRNVIKVEDFELLKSDRRKLVATTKDLQRNFSVAQWAVNKHLDYVSRFNFVSQTGVEVIDDRLEKLWNDWEAACDICKRHTLKRMMRLFEAGKTTDGDAALLKVTGGYLQGIEGNRISKPDFGYPTNFNYAKLSEHGLVLSDVGAVLQYCVCDRTDLGQLKYATLIDADDLVFDGYFFRFDQYRGVSPLASALNTFQDLLESYEFQLIKAKMHAMFGVAIYSDASSNSGTGFIETDVNSGAAPTSATTRYEFDLKAGMKLELQPGDKIETIESSTPSNEFQSYSELMLRLALLSIDLPYTFLDTRSANFSGRKMDMVEYDLSSRSKRENNRNVLMRVAEWKIPQIVQSDVELKTLMESESITIDNLSYDFRPEGVPWIDESAEVNAAVMRINSGLSSWGRETKRRGDRFKDIVEELGYEQSLIKKYGANVSVAQPGQTSTTTPPANPEPPPQDNTKPPVDEAVNE